MPKKTINRELVAKKFLSLHFSEIPRKRKEKRDNSLSTPQEIKRIIKEHIKENLFDKYKIDITKYYSCIKFNGQHHTAKFYIPTTKDEIFCNVWVGPATKEIIKFTFEFK
jgi:hypothetical protein